LNRDGNDNSILYKFTHSGRQKAIVAAEFSRFKRSRVFEASFSTLSTHLSRSRPAAFGHGYKDQLGTIKGETPFGIDPSG